MKRSALSSLQYEMPLIQENIPSWIAKRPLLRVFENKYKSVSVLRLEKLLLFFLTLLSTTYSFKGSLVRNNSYNTEPFKLHNRYSQTSVQTAVWWDKYCSGLTVLSYARTVHEFRQTRSSGVSSRGLSMVWWFGGSSDAPTESSEDSCELVAVRIEAPTPNSRRIKGEILVQAPLEAVWSILTDYDNLSTHVPNLVESRRIPGYSSSGGMQGDGSYACRLYQKGAQKIVGFEFGASVTLAMKESIICAGPRRNNAASRTSSASFERSGAHDSMMFPAERRIGFKCVDSFFFSEFDGEWRVVETMVDGECCSMVSYVVDVKPRGPVPVAALEWRIREDVPTNLRAVKKASMEIGRYSFMRRQNRGMELSPTTQLLLNNPSTVPRSTTLSKSDSLSGGVEWSDDETMGAYLNKNN
jgi:hypothetical protein